jgi:hypothetical protein
LNFEDFEPKLCSAGRNYASIVPNGDVYTCAGGLSYSTSPLYKNLIGGRQLPKFAMGNLFNAGFRLNQRDMTCALPCKEACDRDSVKITSVRQVGALAASL